MMKAIALYGSWGVFLLMGFGTRSSVADTLQIESVHPKEIRAQGFHEGETLGDGVISKTFSIDESRKPVLHAVKKIKTKPSRLAVIKKPARSIASYEDDIKFNNDLIARVREKDSNDYDQTMAIVHSAIERGDYGQEAKEKMHRENYSR